MSSKKDFPKDIRSTAPSAGPSSIPQLGKSSRTSVVPTRPGVSSSLCPTRIPAPSTMPAGLDQTTRIPAPSTMPAGLDQATRIPAPSKMPIKMGTTRFPAPSKIPTKVDITMIPATSTVNEPPTNFPNITSRAPPNTKSVLLTHLDLQMASKQPNYATLTPQEQTEQDNWAQEMIKRVGACPENFDWVRRENPGGYQCEGGGHGITDELLAEGKGGIMVLATKKWGESKGPYYLDPESGKFQRLYG